MRYYFFSKFRDGKSASFCFFLVSMFLLFIGAISLCVPTRAEGDIYNNVIRFHLIAQSNTAEDQKLKLELRDAVIDEYAQLLDSFSSKNEAYEQLNKMTDEITDFCNDFIMEQGYGYECTTLIGREYYNRTEYDKFYMPEGYYTSLRIIIGNGEGKNWWCVLFPPMCTKAAMNTVSDKDMEEGFIEAGFTGEQYRIITESEKPRYRIKFKLIELFFGD